MQIALDTNVFIHIFNGQEKSEICYAAIASALRNNDSCWLSASAVTDIYYLVRKKLGREQAVSAISAILGMARVFDVNERDVRTALGSAMNDFEDAVFVSAAKRNGADLILTYNERDFAKAGLPSVTPDKYLEERARAAEQ